MYLKIMKVLEHDIEVFLDVVCNDLKEDDMIA
jgi:hypothetical protein